MYVYFHAHAVLFTETKIQKQPAGPLTDERIKKKVLYTCNGMSFILKKEGNPAVCDTIIVWEGHYAKWNKPVTEKQMLHGATYMRCLK